MWNHGKTTLTDQMMKQCGMNARTGKYYYGLRCYRARARITIYSKNTSVNYKGTKINIVDTPATLTSALK